MQHHRRELVAVFKHEEENDRCCRNRDDNIADNANQILQLRDGTGDESTLLAGEECLNFAGDVVEVMLR